MLSGSLEEGRSPPANLSTCRSPAITFTKSHPCVASLSYSLFFYGQIIKTGFAHPFIIMADGFFAGEPFALSGCLLAAKFALFSLHLLANFFKPLFDAFQLLQCVHK